MSEGSRDQWMARHTLSDFDGIIEASYGGNTAPATAASVPLEEPRMISPRPDGDGPRHLSAVPTPGVPDQRAPVSKWILTLSEPLISTRARAEADRQMAAFIDRNYQWSTNWFAGFMSDLMRTLPPNDPWRHLSAFIDLSEISRGVPATTADNRLSFHHRDALKPPPRRTGAYRVDGSPFGKFTDAADLVAGDLVDEPGLDIGLTALADPINPLTAALIGFAGANIELLASVTSKVYHHLLIPRIAEGAGDEFLDAAGSALRWIIHRRRSYTGHDDPFPTLAGFAWMGRADRVTAGEKSIASEPSMARDALIDPSAYDDLRNDFF